jgi:hypothetical protein
MILQYFHYFFHAKVSSLYAHLKEHRYGLDGIVFHLGDENLELVFLRSMFDR